MNRLQILLCVLLIALAGCSKPIIKLRYAHGVSYEVEVTGAAERDKLFDRLQTWLTREGLKKAVSPADISKVSASSDPAANVLIYLKALDPGEPESLASFCCVSMEPNHYLLILHADRYGTRKELTSQEPLMEHYLKSFETAFLDLKQSR